MSAASRRRPTLAAWAVIAVAAGWLGLTIAVPVILVFTEALSKGWQAYTGAFGDPEFKAALALTLKVAAITVPRLIMPPIERSMPPRIRTIV